MRDGRVKIKIIRMRKTRERGRFLVEAIGRVIANCRPVRVMTAWLRERLARMEIGRLQAICLVFIAGMLLCDVVLLFQGGGRTRAAPPITVIRPVTTVGTERRQPRVKAFGEVWDSLMTDTGTKRSWDSLLRMRPGLRDTITLIQRMDSAVWGK